MWCLGFITGMGKGLVGAVANPLSGSLDAISSTFEGIDAASSTLLRGRDLRPQAAVRSRLPRAIGGDRKLLPFKRPPNNTETQAGHSFVSWNVSITSSLLECLEKAFQSNCCRDRTWM